ncbi:calcium/sodium antiporter [Alkaliphilus hydrothermalis]|uniref:Cation:H+ antiporter n=1 Tax=Alkaliphilus hydrothermalis TaxID=1482730 RepID=A0ABS2NS81_9FIRM|nr:calcium/sodium antiporter [Alkaliphilus hydrothermalis]MBM7615813.1 cation:H+ antiporter [Alkaliphilus hydrothermalis]
MGILGIVLLFSLGLFIIIKGGDWFVVSAVWLAKVTGIPNVLIGATIVSIATTLPELLVSSIATHQEFYDVAIGNVVGSMVCNIGLILGLTAILSPIQIQRRSFTVKSSFMLLTCGVLYYLAFNRIISSGEGNVFLILFGIYIAMNIMEFSGRGKKNHEFQGMGYDRSNSLHYIGRFVLGAIFITLGARLLVNNGVALAGIIGIPEQVVSLTLIALGTSLPELTTAITAVVKKQQGISVGNIIGANVLNMVMVLGVCSKLASEGIVISYQNIMMGATIFNIPQTLYLDLPITLLMMVIITIGGFLTGKISRGLGFGIFGIYCIYLFTLVRLFM